jgi:cell division protein FtsQ
MKGDPHETLGNQMGRRPSGNRPVNTVKHLIELAPDSPKQREMRKEERRRRGLKLAGVVAGALALVAVGRAAVQESLFNNPRFYLKEVHVETQGMLTPHQIGLATELKMGQNLLTVNLQDVRARIESLPAVESASVQRDFEGKLSIHVRQRHPVAWVECKSQSWPLKVPGQGLLTDASGVAIPALSYMPEYVTLPVIRDETIRNEIQPRVAIHDTRFAAALKLVNSLHDRESQCGMKLKEVEVKHSFALQASFVDGAQIMFSHDDLDSQLARFDRFAAEALSQKWTVRSLNLVAEYNTPVVLANVIDKEPPSALPFADQPATAVRRATPVSHSPSSTTRNRRSR